MISLLLVLFDFIFFLLLVVFLVSLCLSHFVQEFLQNFINFINTSPFLETQNALDKVKKS